MTGGTHKCPLCAATFTRPQHVGRHLRSHTGDRPYECKECPLKFARSDLLARHVGKAHRPADGSAPPKTTKKGRRKSMPTSVHPSHEDQAESSSAANLSTVPSGQGPMPQRADVKPRRASSGHQVPGPFAPINQTAYFNTAVSPSNNEPQPPPQLQAQRMYPHHPLLAGTPQPPQLQQQQSWLGGQGLGTITASSPPSFFNPFNPGPNTAGPATALPYNPMLASQSPYAGVPMRISGSDQSTGSGGSLSMGRSGSSSYGYEFGWKKRACDQCNQSKVRCDSQEPCQRCSQRNIRCSYNKPTKSRSMVAYSTPKFALPLSAGPSSMSFAGSAGSSAHQSASPVSHFSSPLSNGNPSPVTATMNQPLPPVAPSMPVGQPILQGQGQWTIPEPVAGSVPTRAPLSSAIPSQSTLPNQWQNGLQQRSQRASSTASYTSPLANVVPIPSQTSVPTVVPSARRTSSGGSSLQYLAPTPSLTTSTSPSSSEEPSERRVSHGSQMSGTYVFNPMGGSFDLGPKNEMANVPSQDLNGYNMPQSFSPTSVEAMVANALPSTTTFQPDYSQFAWSVPSTANTVGTMGSVNSIGSVGPLATGTIDPRGSLRKSQDPVNFSEDEDNGPTVSRPASSAASAFGSTNFSMVDENGNPLLVEAAQRRMSSTGVWASAFNQMSLQDRNAGVVDPYTASQVASQLQAKRPSYPVLHPGQTALHPHGTFFDPNAAPNGAGQKAPSLRDVKDLWKLFMSEPMTNQGSQGQAQSELHTQSVSQQQVLDKEQPASSRPAMGQRGLSRSNSMPELLSPVANGQMFFSNFLNGATPRPTEPQSSYMLQQKPVGGTSISPEDIAVKNENDSDGQITMGKGGDENLRQWKDQIKNRQASFYFDPKVNGRFGPGSQNMVPNGNHMHSAGLVMGMGMDSSSQNPGMAFDASMPGGFSRPLASVFQYNPALQQTLAPERAISFGMDGMPTPTPARTNFAATNYLSARSQPAANALNASPARGSNGMPMPTKKVTSLLARPGNKRLASQTLVPDAGKKLGYWDDGDDSSPFDGDVEDADDDGGLLGKRAVQGSGLGTLGGGGYYGIPS